MFQKATQNAIKIIQKTTKKTKAELKNHEVSEIASISAGTALLKGLSNVQMDEMLLFNGHISGMVQTLYEDSVGVVFLDNPDSLKAGDKAVRTNRILDIPVSTHLLGRVIDAVGKPLDGKGSIEAKERRPIEREAYA
ncbi:MAG: F0F1 ATP synthase subunit alpha, partial [Alphaproteobacteria bacterium]|nr:F0F1 ATP synthase subunit alpha [Alphaproteobacteria bacterium]